MLYGDNNNWFAAWAFWQLKIYGHKELSAEVPVYQPTSCHSQKPDYSIRAFLPDVQREPFDELKAVYASEEIDGGKPVIAYCRIGERSSYSWFVLKYLLGYKNIVNYDGSWTEWGNLVVNTLVAHAG